MGDPYRKEQLAADAWLVGRYQIYLSVLSQYLGSLENFSFSANFFYYSRHVQSVLIAICYDSQNPVASGESGQEESGMTSQEIL